MCGTTPLLSLDQIAILLVLSLSIWHLVVSGPTVRGMTAVVDWHQPYSQLLP
jgi:hypothetical protein